MIRIILPYLELLCVFWLVIIIGDWMWGDRP